MSIVKPLFQRLWKYAAVGTSTYLLDLILIYTLREYVGFSDALALGTGFVIAVSINFLGSYYWVYRGTERQFFTGYAYFGILAIIGLLVIIPSTLFVQSFLSIDIYYARTIVAVCIGIVAFLINTFYNFKVLH